MFKKLYLRLKIALLRNAILRADAEIIDADLDDRAFLINFYEGTPILVSLEENDKIIRLESTIIFNSELISLKTLSSMAHAAFCSGFAVTGFSQKDEKQVKIYLMKDLDFPAIFSRFADEMGAMHELIAQLVEYLSYRTIQLEHRALDLSMFENIDLFLFNPKSLGENKDFIYKNWSNYIESVLSENREGLTDSETLAAEIEACAEFERVNGLELSEVGDNILQEIIWNRKFSEIYSMGDYSIN